MDDTAIQTKPTPAPDTLPPELPDEALAIVKKQEWTAGDVIAALKSTQGRYQLLLAVLGLKSLGPWQILSLLASLRLTVVLFALGIFLVLAGTVAQVDSGIWTVVNKYFRCFYVTIPLYIFFPRAWNVPVWLGIPYPGGWLIGSLLLINLLAAHAVRFKVTWKRSGILVLHAGMILMLLGELITGLFAIEGSMAIDEGGSANYVTHNRYAELAIIDPSDPKTDDVVVVPEGRLRKDKLVQHEFLPFDVEVVEYMINSRLAEPKNARRANPATAGAGLERVAVSQDEISGTDQSQQVDVPSAYLTFKRKSDGKSLGTYLMTVWADAAQQVAVDGKTYDVALRFKRTYKPYSVHLIDFRFDRYPGTSTPKNYSSQVRLVDPERNEDREVLIMMNEPFRYRGDTLFQADFDKRTERTTILQVVRNPGWQLPYWSCGLVSIGMIIHFSMNLIGFLGRRTAA